MNHCICKYEMILIYLQQKKWLVRTFGFTNLSLINWKIDRRITSNTNMSTPCAQFQMSVMRKIILPGVSKNEIISKIHATPAITNSPKYTWTLKGKEIFTFICYFEATLRFWMDKSHLSMCLVDVFWKLKLFSCDCSVAVARLRASWKFNAIKTKSTTFSRIIIPTGK